MGENLPIKATPGDLYINFNGIEKSASWVPTYGEPIEGWFQCPYISPEYYEFSGGGILIQVTTDGLSATILATTAETYICFSADYLLDPDGKIDNEAVEASGFWHGEAQLIVAGVDTDDPRFETDYDLIGQTEGSPAAFLERETLVSSTTRRYARQADHTRIYIRRG